MIANDYLVESDDQRHQLPYLDRRVKIRGLYPATGASLAGTRSIDLRSFRSSTIQNLEGLIEPQDRVARYIRPIQASHERSIMEQQVLDLLAATLDPSSPIRTNAELQLEQLYTNDAFPRSLISIAAHQSVPLQHRQAALLSLKKLVLKTWSPSLEEFEGKEALTDATKTHIRQSILTLTLSSGEERKIVAASSYVVSKIASVDFPEQWPDLLSTLLTTVPEADATQLHSVLVVLGNLVEDGFDDEQFSASATELVRCLFHISVDGKHKYASRALAISTFRACFDTLELAYQNNQAAVQQFMQEASDAWLPFFMDVLKAPLPDIPTKEQEMEASPGSPEVQLWRGLISLKTQVVKVGLSIT